jgi:hypothetical protein
MSWTKRRTTCALGALGIAFLMTAASVRAQENPPDQYLCYTAGSAFNKKRPPIGKARVDLIDLLGGPQRFAVRRLASLCNPASLDGSLPSHPNVHLEGLTIKPDRGTPKFVPTTAGVRDVFGSRTLALKDLWALLDVTPVQPGTGTVADFNDDPTMSAVELNRFKCYVAALPKGTPKFVPPPPPTVTDEVFTHGQQFLVKNVTKLCLPTDADGATPDAPGRGTLLVCYGVKLPKGGKFPRETVGTRSRTAGPRTVGRRKPAELCIVAHAFPGD